MVTILASSLHLCTSESRLGYPKWNEAQVQKRIKEGRGTGHGADYKNWIDIHDYPSTGVVSRVPSLKFKRSIDVFSTIELRTLYLLEILPGIDDAREQFPLDRDRTQEIARRLKIRHPCYPGTSVPRSYDC